MPKRLPMPSPSCRPVTTETCRPPLDEDAVARLDNATVSLLVKPDIEAEFGQVGALAAGSTLRQPGTRIADRDTIPTMRTSQAP